MSQNNTDQKNILSQPKRMHRLFPLAILANLAPLILCFLYMYGDTVLLATYPLIYIFTFKLNNRSVSTLPQVITLGSIHVAVTLCTVLHVGLLYLSRVTDDYVSLFDFLLSLVISTAISVGLALLQVRNFYRNQKSAPQIQQKPCQSENRDAHVIQKNKERKDILLLLKQKHCLFPLALLANLAPLGLCYLYMFGAMLLLVVYPPIHIFTFKLNNRSTSSLPQVITLGLTHIVVTACTFLHIGLLYLSRITDDPEGRLVMLYSLVISTAITVSLAILQIKNFYRNQKSIQKD